MPFNLEICKRNFRFTFGCFTYADQSPSIHNLYQKAIRLSSKLSPQFSAYTFAQHICRKNSFRMFTGRIKQNTEFCGNPDFHSYLEQKFVPFRCNPSSNPKCFKLQLSIISIFRKKHTENPAPDSAIRMCPFPSETMLRISLLLNIPLSKV